MESPKKTRRPYKPWYEGHKKPGPKPGSHWNHDRERKSFNPLAGSVEEWPGPFQKRTDFDSVRPAYWLNCPICNVLFMSNVSEAKTPNFSRVSGKRASARYCSLSCAGNSKAKPIFRVCSFCAKTFRVYQRNYNRLTCCEDCSRSVIGDKNSIKKSQGLVVYAFEHGIMADREALTCDLCGHGQSVHYSGDRGRGNAHWYVRVTNIKGKWVARCKHCYHNAYQVQKKLDAAMTPAEKLRRKQAQELIKELL